MLNDLKIFLTVKAYSIIYFLRLYRGNKGNKMFIPISHDFN